MLEKIIENGILGSSRHFESNSKTNKNGYNESCCLLSDYLNSLVGTYEAPPAIKEQQEVKTAAELLVFYTNFSKKNGKLPSRKEVAERTNLTEYRVNKLNKELIEQGSIISTGNQLKLK